MWNLITGQQLKGGGTSLPNQHTATTQNKLLALGFANKKRFDKEADQLPVVPMSQEKCQPEHFTLADKESGAVIFSAVSPHGTQAAKKRWIYFYFYFPGFKKTNLIRAVEYELIHLRSLHVEQELEATGHPPSIFFRTQSQEMSHYY